jgi:N-acyl-D-aspartate/D-glutamate deacylase
MTLQVSQSVVATGTTPSALTPAASDTIAETSFGPYGLYARVITAGTATDVAVTDPNVTKQGNPGTVTAVSAPATGVRMIFIPRSAVAASGVATITFSGARTNVTYELYRA